MSYYAFTVDMSDQIGRWKQDGTAKQIASTHAELLDKATWAVVQQWLRDKRYRDLVAWAVENFDTYGGDQFIVPLSDALAASGELTLLRKLWKGVICNHRRTVGRMIPETDLPTTGPYREAYQSTINSMHHYAAALDRLGEYNEVDFIREELALFRAGKQRLKRHATDPREMTERIFWELISESRASAGSSVEQAKHLTERLEAFRPRQIMAFQRILNQKLADSYTWDLWALAFIAQGGCGDDGFDYFRAWLVAQDRDVFERILADVNASINEFTAGEIGSCESLLYVAQEAYENSQGKRMGPVKNSRPLQPAGVSWEEEELADRYPHLYAHFAII